MEQRNHIPDVFVIGAMKAGTSTLYWDFFNHPNICRTHRKEVNFFIGNDTVSGLNEKYKKQFANAALLKCDVSPTYAQCHKYPGIAQKIYQANPNAKLILITRDPVDRIISHLHHNLLRDRFQPHQLEREVIHNNDYLLCSKYYYQIQEYLKFYPKEQILVLMLEELKLNPALFTDRINAFLGTDYIVYHRGKFNVSEKRYIIKWHDLVHGKIKSSIVLKAYHYIWYVLNIQPEKPELTPHLKSALKEKLREDVTLFCREFDLDQKLWLNFNEGVNS